MTLWSISAIDDVSKVCVRSIFAEAGVIQIASDHILRAVFIILFNYHC